MFILCMPSCMCWCSSLQCYPDAGRANVHIKKISGARLKGNGELECHKRGHLNSDMQCLDTFSRGKAYILPIISRLQVPLGLIYRSKACLKVHRQGDHDFGVGDSV